MQGGKAVAVKLFKGEVSPDGRAVDEIDVTCAVEHPNLTKYVCPVCCALNPQFIS